MDCITYGTLKGISSVGISFSINRGRKTDNQRIEFDVSIIPGRTIQGGKEADRYLRVVQKNLVRFTIEKSRKNTEKSLGNILDLIS